MALGTLGSTLNDELNRLANGGTYRDMNQMVDEALAAKQWANRENINPYSTDTVGILNEIAGLGLDKKNWLDFNGVCNYIAGTTGLPAAAALRQVYPTTDLLTGVASYYVDAAYPTGLTNTPGYVYLNGTAGNNMSSPDSSALDITGDIDIRVRVALDDWTPAANQILLSKYNTATNQRSYRFDVTTEGKLQALISSDGTSGTATVFLSTIGVTVNDGAIKWVRVVIDVNNGSSAKDALFYTSDDGTTWTQLGTTVTFAGTTSIFASTTPLVVGSAFDGTSPVAGKIYQTQIRNGIDGTVEFNANMSNVSLTATSFTESSSNAATVTINGFRAYPQTADNLGAAGSLLPTTLGSSTAADSNDPKFLDFTGTNYVYLPGVNSNYLSVPDAAPLDITGDIDIRWYGAADSYILAGRYQRMLAKRTLGQWSWDFYFDADGRLTFAWTANGSTSIAKNSTVAPTVANGTPIWLRVTLDVDNGASGNDVTFYTSNNGTTWTQLGSVVTTAGTTSIHSGTAPIEIGSTITGQEVLVGKIFRAQIFNGIDGTKVLDVDTSVITAGSATSFTAVTGQTVTINRSTSGRKTVAVTQPTWLFGTDDYMEVNNRYMSSGTYLYLPGVAGNYASAPDSAALDITGDIDIRCKVALDDWTPAAVTSLIGKTDAASQRSYNLSVNTSGDLRFGYSTTGSDQVNVFSSVVTGFADGVTKWVRVTRNATTGDIQFFTSDDGSSWTQLGTTRTSTPSNIFASTSVLEVGSVVSGASDRARGKFFRAQVRNGINGTVAFDANFETSITSLNQASFTESSANAAAVTINRSGSAYRSAGITAAGYLYPGATNTFSASATDFLNFGASDSFTVVWFGRLWATPVTGRVLIGKAFSGSPFTGWAIMNQAATTQARLSLYDGTTSVNAFGFTPVSGALSGLAAVLDRSTQFATVYTNLAAGTRVPLSTLGSLSTIMTLRIPSWSDGLLTQDAEIYAAAVFRQALSVAQIRQITNYFANREVYL